MNKKLQDDKQVLEETIWLIALHMEKFLCKNNTLPCQVCRTMAIKLTPLFLVGIEGIAEKTYLDSRRLAHLALDKIGMQKWEIKRPWKSDAFLTPITIEPVEDSKPKDTFLGRLNSLFGPKTREVVTYKLATRVPTKEEE